MQEQYQTKSVRSTAVPNVKLHRFDCIHLRTVVRSSTTAPSTLFDIMAKRELRRPSKATVSTSLRFSISRPGRDDLLDRRRHGDSAWFIFHHSNVAACFVQETQGGRGCQNPREKESGNKTRLRCMAI